MRRPKLVGVSLDDEPPKLKHGLTALIPTSFDNRGMVRAPPIGSPDDVLPTFEAEFVLDRAVCYELPDAGACPS
ncbi:hypothetical protein [Nonomuraea deserti]|uniref:hypothetical protein n=1 Tax=Nonomuraea deserti TaxID=1848322 RepID=UPI00104AC91B|nr:hypothetical protein [Nonomuraea deserti]